MTNDTFVKDITNLRYVLRNVKWKVKIETLNRLLVSKKTTLCKRFTDRLNFLCQQKFMRIVQYTVKYRRIKI